MNNIRENNHNLFNDQDIQTWAEEDQASIKINYEKPISPETIADKYSRSQLRVVRETKDFTLDYLKYALKIDSPIINVAPEYQRRQRWSLQKKSQLIESFLMNIPIPPIFLFARAYNKYEVVDGRQRLDTIREYLNDEFGLKGLDYWSELNNKTFQQLPDIIKRGLLRSSLPAIVLLTETRNSENDFDVRKFLFDRLNTGGDKLSPQELRNALYPGHFNKMLIRVARSDEFTKTWGIPAFSIGENEQIPDDLSKNVLYKNMADCELVLRFFAIEEAIKRSDRGSLKKLLDSCMERHYKDAPYTVEGLEKRYQIYFGLLFDIFDGMPFYIPNISRPSRTLYDAMMVAMSLLDMDELDVTQRANIQQRLQTTLDDPEKYELMVGRKGVLLDYIKQRIRIASTILTGRVRDDRFP